MAEKPEKGDKKEDKRAYHYWTKEVIIIDQLLVCNLITAF